MKRYLIQFHVNDTNLRAIRKAVSAKQALLFATRDRGIPTSAWTAYKKGHGSLLISEYPKYSPIVARTPLSLDPAQLEMFP